MLLKHYISMIRIHYLLFFTFLFTTGFAYRESNYCKMVDRITKSYLKEFAKPHQLTLSSYGGAMANDIQEIFLGFLSFDAINVDEARILYVEMMEEYLKRVNNHEKVRPYLHEFPFGIDNIKLDIGFENNERKITRDGHVAMIFIGRNHTIYYDAYDPIKKFYSLHREPYEEALKLVKEANSVSNKVENGG